MPKKKPDEIAINIADLIPGQTINIPPDTKVTIKTDLVLPPAPIPGVSVGANVQYTTATHEQPRAAIILHVVDKVEGTVNLLVFYDGQDDGYPDDNCAIRYTNVEYSEFNLPGTWHFIEKA